MSKIGTSNLYITRPFTVLSLGAGVQSSTLLLMACRGEIPMPEIAVFADTQWEPKAVYDWLDVLKGEAEKAGIPIIVTSRGNLRQDTLDVVASGKGFVDIPLHTHNEHGKPSMLKRQCTYNYKIQPIRQVLHRERKRVGAQRVELWFGITTDEATRVRHSDVRYLTHRYPLIEMGLTRQDCIQWLKKNGYLDVPKSSCIGCPHHDNSYWRNLQKNTAEWEDAVAFDKTIRKLPNITGDVFVHRNIIPLEDAVLDDPQQATPLFDGMADECEGMCGV